MLALVDAFPSSNRQQRQDELLPSLAALVAAGLPDDQEEWLPVLYCSVDGASDSNHRVSLPSLEILRDVVGQVGERALPFLGTVAPVVAAGLGDSKVAVREAAFGVLVALMAVDYEFKVTLEHMGAYLGHRSWRVRAGLVDGLGSTLQHFGASVYGSGHDQLLPVLQRLLDDQHHMVRAKAVEALVAMHAIMVQEGTDSAGGDGLLEQLKDSGARAGHLNELRQCFGSVLEANKENAPSSGVAEGKVRSQAGRCGPGRAAAPVAPPAAAPSAAEVPALDPHRVYTEAEMGRELEGVVADLTKSVDDWQLRVAALQRIHALALGGGEQFDGFGKGLKGMHEVIGAHIVDLRSQVAKEACRTVGAVAHAMGDGFNSLSDLWIPQLFKQTGNAVVVFSAAADEALVSIVGATGRGYGKMVPLLIKNASAKVPLHRAKALKMLSRALDMWEGAVFDRATEAIETLLKSKLKDSDGSARAEARRCFWSFAERYPAAAARIRDVLDAGAQRHLDTARPGQVLPQSSPAPDRPHALSQPNGVLDSPAQYDEDDTSMASAYPVEKSAQSARRQSMSASGPLRVANRTMKQTPTPSVNILPNPAATAPRNSGLLRAEPADARSDPPTPAARLGAPRRLSTAGNGEASSSREQARSRPRRMEGPIRVVACRPPVAQPQCSPVAVAEGGAAAMPPTPPPQQNQQHHQHHRQHQPSLSSAGASPGAAFPRKTPTIDLVAAVDAVLNGGVQWVERVTCAESIEALLTDWGSLNSGDAERMRRGVLHLVSDQHHKVVQATLEAVLNWLRNGVVLSMRLPCAGHEPGQHGSHPVVESLLPKVGARLHDGKDRTRELAKALLDELRVKVEAPVLLMSVIPHLGEASGATEKKVLVSLLQFALPLILHTSAQFQERGSTTLRTFIVKIAAILKATKPREPLRVTAMANLVALFRLGAAVFASQLRQVPLEKQNTLKRALKADHPELHAELEAIGKSHAQERKSSGGQGLTQTLEQGHGHASPFSNRNASGPSCANRVNAGNRSSPSVRGSSGAQSARTPSQISASRGGDGRSSASPLDGTPPSDSGGTTMLIRKMDRSQPPETRLEAINAIVHLVQRKQIEGQDFGPVVLVLVEGLSQNLVPGAASPSLSLDTLACHHAALVALRALIARYPGQFNAYADMVTARLLIYCSLFPFELAKAAEVVLAALLSTLEPLRCLVAVQGHLNAADRTQAPAVRVFKKLVSRLPSAHLMEVMPALLPGLLRAFADTESVDLRKGAVLALVEMYVVLGNHLMVALSGKLTPSQLKLLTIYIHKRRVS